MHFLIFSETVLWAKFKCSLVRFGPLGLMFATHDFIQLFFQGIDASIRNELLFANLLSVLNVNNFTGIKWNTCMVISTTTAKRLHLMLTQQSIAAFLQDGSVTWSSPFLLANLTFPVLRGHKSKITLQRSSVPDSGTDNIQWEFLLHFSKTWKEEDEKKWKINIKKSYTINAEVTGQCRNQKQKGSTKFSSKINFTACCLYWIYSYYQSLSQQA